MQRALEHAKQLPPKQKNTELKAGSEEDIEPETVAEPEPETVAEPEVNKPVKTKQSKKNISPKSESDSDSDSEMKQAIEDAEEEQRKLKERIENLKLRKRASR